LTRRLCGLAVAVAAYEAATLCSLAIHLDRLAATAGSSVGVAGVTRDVIAVTQRTVLVNEFVVGEAALMSARLLLVKGGLGARALGLRVRHPGLAICLVGTLLAHLGRFAVLSGGRLAAARKLALAPTVSHATAHGEQQQRRDH
jgi:hypothetical protein